MQINGYNISSLSAIFAYLLTKTPFDFFYSILLNLHHAKALETYFLIKNPQVQQTPFHGPCANTQTLELHTMHNMPRLMFCCNLTCKIVNFWLTVRQKGFEVNTSNRDALVEKTSHLVAIRQVIIKPYYWVN